MLFGMVMLLKPRFPLSPVTVKNKPVIVALFAVIMTLVICMLVMFPLKVRFTVLPLSVKVDTVAFASIMGAGVGLGVDVRVQFEAPKAKSVPLSEPTYNNPSATAADDQQSEPSNW